MENFFAIIGGMGTQATELFVHELNSKVNAKKDQDYPNYLLFNHASVPDRTAYILGQSELCPFDFLSEDIKQLEPLKPNFIAIPCNTSHYFYEDLQALTSIPILHMPRLAVQRVKIRFPFTKKVGIVATTGTLKSGIYDKEILDAGYEPVMPDTALQEKVMKLLYDDIKQKDYVDRQLYHDIIHTMTKQFDADVVILACTELSVAQKRCRINDVFVIDAQLALVDECLKRTFPAK
ncbi:MAG: amino acid racemase [Enterococcus sp.]|nr:amino acid racemase [Enterococcus sp.]